MKSPPRSVIALAVLVFAYVVLHQVYSHPDDGCGGDQPEEPAMVAP